MFKTLAFMMQNNAFLRALLGCLGLLPDSCGSGAKFLAFLGRL
jgi:hypothetical protein